MSARPEMPANAKPLPEFKRTLAPPTPGPWYVGDDRAHDCPDHKDSGLALVDTGRQEDWPIARLVEWNNAHLLAAAPDLLDGCHALLGLIEFVCQRSDMPLGLALILRTNHRVAEARAAISKAEGR